MKIEKVSCYKEWLPLEKKQFRVLVVIAEQKEFEGNLTELCQRLSLSSQTKTRNRLKEAIEQLTKDGFCEYTKIGQKYFIKIIPQECEVQIDPRAIDDLRNKRYSVESVAWEQVLKVYLWICKNNWDDVITNAMISKALGGISESVISRAKSALLEFDAIHKENENVKLDDGTFRTIGQHICANAWWNYKGKDIK